MRIPLTFCFAATVLATAAPAFAASFVLCGGASCLPGTPTNVNLVNNLSPGSSMDVGNVGIGGPEVDFTSSDPSNLDADNGQAQITRDDGQNIDNLTFTLLTGAFTAAEFDLEQGTPKSFTITLTTSNGDTSPVLVNNSAGSNWFDIIGGTGESFTSATIQAPGGSDGSFKDFKQLRLIMAAGSVPEPATWALMLVGFGGIGVMLRRGRRRESELMQIA